MIKVQKRNGTLVPYEVDKIKNAISKAFKSCDYQVEEKVMDDIISDIEIFDGIGVEEIQDQIEEILMDYDYPSVAKNYILYREKHSQARFIRDRISYMYKYSNSHDNAATSSETDGTLGTTI